MNASRPLLVAALLPLVCLSFVRSDPPPPSAAATATAAGSSAGSGSGSGSGSSLGAAPSAGAGAGPGAGPGAGHGVGHGAGHGVGHGVGHGAAPTAGSATAGTWLWPLPPPHSVLRGFQAPATLYAPGHRGLDLSSAAGREVVAPAAGVVSFAGVVVDRPVLSIEHADGLVSSLEPVSAGVAVGDRVTAGQPVGQVADGGHCAGRCVHLGARLNGGYVSPLLYLVGVPRAVLLPTLTSRDR